MGVDRCTCVSRPCFYNKACETNSFDVGWFRDEEAEGGNGTSSYYVFRAIGYVGCLRKAAVRLQDAVLS